MSTAPSIARPGWACARDLYHHALAFARRGFPVLPLHSADSSGRCTCGNPKCRDVAKHPIGALARNGLTNATCDEARIRCWFAQGRPSNLGVRTDKVLIIDVDPRNGGDKTLAQIERERGPFPPTWRSITGGDGQHIWLARPAGLDISSRQNAFGPGIDVKAGGRAYVVAAPSLHQSGNRYAWHDEFHPARTPLAAIPAWVAEFFAPPPQPVAREWQPQGDDDERVRDALMSVPVETIDHDGWVRIGMALKSHFGKDGLDLWDKWSRQSKHYDRKGLERVWLSFRGNGVTIATIFHFAKEHRRVA